MTDLVSDTAVVIEADSIRMECLQAVRALNLPDWFIAAGFVRNAIWDHLHHLPMTPLNDVDVVYFDPNDCSLATEAHYAALLQQQLPMINWEVKNQARMHLKHQHSPYKNSADAISRWVEVPTCVGVRLTVENQFIFTAAYGLEHNWSLHVSINPHYPRPAVYQQRIRDKKWQVLWPRLKILTADYS
ncbi:nucleotidyltransferase family protein [Photobacterium iliopiscarium]|uniref:nucleotidyltransferase family protein n=1 Tax=Photobacterium iliopiscarium TaxID=56192 RepID=UPI001E48E1CD|nr:nucleotidyltransferase family protein [Photobacterium iliopiscarium]